MHKFIVSWCLLATISAAWATDYCSSSICGKDVKHIACGHNGNFDSSCPADATMVKMTNGLKKVIVNAHNAKRDFIAGGGDPRYKKACRMGTMQWDDELASLAALNVKQCKMSHDRCRNTDAFKYSGQNLGWFGIYGQTTDGDITKFRKFVDIWFSENKDAKQEYIDAYPTNYSGPQIGHFTVMMSDRNIRVGCAASTYSPSNESYNAYLIACNYAFTNVINYPIYKSCDKAASECKSGINPKHRNLCSVSEHYDINKFY